MVEKSFVYAALVVMGAYLIVGSIYSIRLARMTETCVSPLELWYAVQKTLIGTKFPYKFCDESSSSRLIYQFKWMIALFYIAFIPMMFLAFFARVAGV